uniref:Trimeric intracellular cation channel type B n=1 Tax=Romanomermis culicivorax TaxID=13658 RepID=A0A915JKG6_ROMCU
MSCMMMCFAGSFMASFLMGEPIIYPFKRHDDIILASIVWYLIFYSPFDVCYKAAKFLPLKVILSVLKEVQRAHKVHSGVAHAMKIYPNAYIVMVIIGTVKGAGSGIIRTFEQLVRGVWVPMNNELLRPTFYTKACVIASIMFVMEKKSTYINLPHEVVYFGVVIFLVYFKLSSLLLGVHDIFMPFENLFCALFMGGICDAFSRARALVAKQSTVGPTGSQPSDQQNVAGVKESKKDL